MMDVEEELVGYKAWDLIEEVIPEHPTNVLSENKCCNGMLVAYYLENASDRMKVFNFGVPAKHLSDVELPGIGTIVASKGKHNSNEFFYKF